MPALSGDAALRSELNSYSLPPSQILRIGPPVGSGFAFSRLYDWDTRRASRINGDQQILILFEWIVKGEQSRVRPWPCMEFGAQKAQTGDFLNCGK